MSFRVLAGTKEMVRSVLLFAIATLVLCCAIAQSPPASSPTTKQDLDSLPAGAGKALVQKYCVSCHNIRIVTGKRGTEEEWNATIDKMISAHAVPLSDADADTIVDYLFASFGSSAPKPSGDSPVNPQKPQ